LRQVLRSSPRKRRPRETTALVEWEGRHVVALGSGSIPLPESAVRLGRIAERQKKISPCFGSGPGDRPHSSFFRLPHVEGDGAPTRRTAWIARPEVARLAAGPGRETSRPAPCGAPTRHLRLTPQSAIGPHQELYVPGGLVPRPPVGQACVRARPQVAAPDPRSQDAS